MWVTRQPPSSLHALAETVTCNYPYIFVFSVTDVTGRYSQFHVVRRITAISFKNWYPMAARHPTPFPACLPISCHKLYHSFSLHGIAHI